MSNPNGWIGIDLDGTLAHYNGWKGPGCIGDPIPRMIELVRRLLENGNNVRIFTARVCSAHPPQERETALRSIQDWCLKHLGRVLPVTAEKDFDMVSLWDDRCVTIEKNTGRFLTTLSIDI